MPYALYDRTLGALLLRFSNLRTVYCYNTVSRTLSWDLHMAVSVD